MPAQMLNTHKIIKKLEHGNQEKKNDEKIALFHAIFFPGPGIKEQMAREMPPKTGARMKNRCGRCRSGQRRTRFQAVRPEGQWKKSRLLHA